MLDSYDSIEFDTIEYLATSGGLSCPDSDARISYYGNNGMPHVLFNGGGMLVGAGEDVIDGSVYHPIVQSLLDDATPLKMSISSFSFDALSGHVTVDLELEGDLENLSSTKLRVAFGESALFNTGTMTDTYDISLDTSALPAEWNASFSYEGSDQTDLTLTLAPDDRALFNVTIDAATAAEGEVVLVFHSQSGQAADHRIVFKVISPQVKILLVDDDGGQDYESLYFIPALDDVGVSYATWNRASTGLSSAVLENFDIVVWQCGWAFPTVDEADRSALATYLDGGGNLFITGQDIGWEMNDDGGAALAWYNNYLHADFVGDDTNMLNLQGVAGDPISDGLSLAISGGDGANNQEYPSDIDPFDDSASVILTYDANRNGGIKVDTGVYKVVYLAFGYEGINNAADRAALMQGIVGWLTPGAAAAGSDLPGMTTLLGNVPNPFNPMTEIKFNVGVDSPVKLGVYDVKGRLVRHLDQGVLNAGEHSAFWNGLDNSGRTLPSGTYFCRVDGAGSSESVKMMLVR